MKFGFFGDRTRYVPSAQAQHHKLTQLERDRLPRSQFALPATRQYPIPDRYHAELALRAMKHESRDTQWRIRQAIREKFPDLLSAATDK